LELVNKKKNPVHLRLEEVAIRGDENMDKKSFISGDAPGKILLKIWWRSSPSTFDRLITSSSDSLLNFPTNLAHFLQEFPVQYQRPI
jgi:hypothetical protein